jgi:hypothetical protein
LHIQNGNRRAGDDGQIQLQGFLDLSLLPLGNIGSFRINNLHPPFNDVRARRAGQIALRQEAYMGAGGSRE